MDPRLKKRIRGLEARQAELVSEIQERQHELQFVVRDLQDLRRAVAVIAGTDERRPSASAEPRSEPANLMRVLAEAVGRLEVGSVGFQAVRVLSAAGRPLHGAEIAAQLEAMGHPVRPHTVAVTLGRMAREGRVVRKVAPNTFELEDTILISNPPYLLDRESNLARALVPQGALQSGPGGRAGEVRESGARPPASARRRSQARPTAGPKGAPGRPPKKAHRKGR